MSIMRGGTALKIFLLLVVFTLISFQSYQDNGFIGFEYRWLNCIDYLEQGTLYGGQPQCGQGPVVYLVGLLLKATGNLQLSAILLNISLNAVLFYVIHLILIKETDNRDSFLRV